MGQDMRVAVSNLIPMFEKLGNALQIHTAFYWQIIVVI